jgi:hypothetical protein
MLKRKTFKLVFNVNPLRGSKVIGLFSLLKRLILLIFFFKKRTTKFNECLETQNASKHLFVLKSLKVSMQESSGFRSKFDVPMSKAVTTVSN